MDTNKLKELAEEVIRIEQNEDEPISTAWALFDSAANPQAILGLIAEVERLRTRLEIDERTPYDGIACRDETIKGLDEKCDRLKRQVDMLINQHMPREPIPDMPGWTRVIDADRLKAENEALRQFAAEAYQVLGALDAPENVLDNASDAASGVPPRHETLLPFFAEGYEALRKDSERYRELRKITPHRFKKLQEAATTDGGDVFYFHADRFDAALDAALEGGGK
ncbi:hypothetical protein HBO32_18390 [Pseudomonas nitroreducens]|uniref:hypothetical protein n=1 Tax=Pseudomonas nitroreducens TaxID=46680 RepID=UPI001642EF37|nr:hypothetical protein [Pseudomonas nitroreducens]NMZ75076.1 hypothetical protein [Pseudomonas nitroreducens]